MSKLLLVTLTARPTEPVYATVVELRDHGDRLLEKRHGLGRPPSREQHLGQSREGPVVARDRDEGRAVGRLGGREIAPAPVLLAELPLDPGDRLGRPPLRPAALEGALEGRDGARHVPAQARQGGAPRVGVEVVPRLEHPLVRALRLGVAPDLEVRVPEHAPGVAVPGIGRHRARRLAGGVVELVAGVEDVGEVAPRAGLRGIEGERAPERPLGEREPAGVGGGAELLDVRIPEPVVGPRVGRAPPEPMLVGGDGAVGGAVVRPRRARGQARQAEERGRERGPSGGAAAVEWIGRSSSGRGSCACWAAC